MTLRATRDTFALAQAFTISRGSRTEAHVITVTIERDGVMGWGECVPYPRYGESVDSVAAQIADLPQTIERDALQSALPPGAARNAVDCALWDWEAKAKDQPVWQLAGLEAPKPCLTAYSLSLGTPQSMQDEAAKHAFRPLLKIKLGGTGDLERLRAVRAGAPDSRLVVDANEGWTREAYSELAPELKALGVEMVEQPMPVGADDALAEISRILPVCADESCHDRATLPGLRGKYDMVNIKLDKTGGLTEALALRDAARAEGYRVMVGCMVGSSLAMAPAMLVAQGAELVDLDAPLLLAEDRETPMVYDANAVHPAPRELWG